jgi:hypothetical protein
MDLAIEVVYAEAARQIVVALVVPVRDHRRTRRFGWHDLIELPNAADLTLGIWGRRDRGRYTGECGGPNSEFVSPLATGSEKTRRALAREGRTLWGFGVAIGHKRLRRKVRR